MKFFSIPPKENLDLMHINENYYCLAHLAIEDNDYLDFFKEMAADGKHVILDNGAAEQSTVDEEMLLYLVNEIKPTEVIPPDYLFDMKKTLEAFHSFKKRTNCPLFACPQGKTPEEWMHCYMVMLMDPQVETIGLSKISVPASFAVLTDSNAVSVNRRFLIEKLNGLGLLKKPIHLLGMRNITEYRAYKNIPMIKSSDSCFTILQAVNGVRLNKNEILDTISETPEEYFGMKLGVEQRLLAEHNIKELNSILDNTSC